MNLIELIVETLYLYLPAYVANAAPVLLGGGKPLDGGRLWIDGRPILGGHKTFRGVFSALILGTLTGLAQAYTPQNLPIDLRWETHTWRPQNIQRRILSSNPRNPNGIGSGIYAPESPHRPPQTLTLHRPPTIGGSHPRRPTQLLSKTTIRPKTRVDAPPPRPAQLHPHSHSPLVSPSEASPKSDRRNTPPNPPPTPPNKLCGLSNRVEGGALVEI